MQDGVSVKSITPIFGQLVMFSLPRGFGAGVESHSEGHYARESTLLGENLNNWKQNITITGEQDLASNPDASPEGLAAYITGNFKQLCPKSVTAIALGPTTIDGHDAFLAFASCGCLRTLTNGENTAYVSCKTTTRPEPKKERFSESLLLIVIKGVGDYYTLQWADKGAASDAPIAFDKAKWMERFQRLAPIMLCPIIPGEQPPYPSCAERAHERDHR